MKIGARQFCINPTFPVNRMLRNEKHMAVSDDLHCRIIAVYPDHEMPFYHVSIDTVELWKSREDLITETIEKALGCQIHCICSATHSHNCPCMTTDDAYVEYVVGLIGKEVKNIKLIEYQDVRYIYQYRYFDKVGKSRVMDYVTPHVYAETASIYGDGKRIITFLIHNVHPTTKDLWVGDFTAEYPGYCISKLREEYPGEFFTFLLGPAGDISPHFVRNGRDYHEMIVRAEMLRTEFDRQLSRQKLEDAVPLQFAYEETTMPKVSRPFKLEDAILPQPLNEDEKIAVDHFKNGGGRPHRELRSFENVTEYHFGHLKFSDQYSMIFEPFELYSEYYGAVNKATTSVISISHGFEHYLTGLYLPRLSMHGSFSNFSDEMRRQMWKILSRWSAGEKA